MSSRCPVVQCWKFREQGHLMCRDHWFMVPRDLRDAVWTAYRGGVRSPSYVTAIRAAIAAVEMAEERTYPPGPPRLPPQDGYGAPNDDSTALTAPTPMQDGRAE